MFSKKTFSNVLKEISDTYENQRDFAEKSSINRTYLSKYINCSLENPPSPKILQKLANASNGVASYEYLMQICGYNDKPKKSELIIPVKLDIAEAEYQIQNLKKQLQEVLELQEKINNNSN